ncbi:MAG: hypothetical protein KHY08_05035 [Lachnospiraceae bacterium]|nr:hypothetical protein [Lachnospiraceae bacterium]
MNEETIAMIKQILEDEESLDKLREKEDYEKKQRFPKEKPLKPEREQVTRRYTPVFSQLKPDYIKWCRPLIVTGLMFIVAMILSAIPPLAIFMALLIFADIFLIGGSVIYIIYCRVVTFPKEKKADEERIRNSREYKEECSKLNLEYDKKQEELDKKFKNRMDAFQKESDAWDKDYHKWQKEKEKSISKIKEEISILESKRDRLYDDLNAIPVHYRKTEIIRYIYHAVSTSDYTIKEAIGLYDRNEQRKIDEARLREQQIYNQLQEEANAYADEMNELQHQANETAAKARRDMNIANAANIYQNHKRNKMIDRMTKK